MCNWRVPLAKLQAGPYPVDVATIHHTSNGRAGIKNHWDHDVDAAVQRQVYVGMMASIRRLVDAMAYVMTDGTVGSGGDPPLPKGWGEVTPPAQE